MKTMLRSFAFALAMIASATAHAISGGFDWNAAITASNPLNWYRFDELSGSVAIDYGSQGLNGVYGAGTLDATRGLPGRAGGAVQFGNQSTVFLSGADLAGDWSAEFVVKRTGSKRSSVLIRGIPFAFPSQALKLEQFNETHQVGYTKYGIIDATFSPAATAPLNEWVHLVYVNRAADDRISLYVNGALAGTRIDHFPLSRDQIGSWSDTIPESPLAIIDEVALYSRALSGGEISQHAAVIPEPTGAALGCVLAISLIAVRAAARRRGGCPATSADSTPLSAAVAHGTRLPAVSFITRCVLGISVLARCVGRCSLRTRQFLA
jgi:hypothetical protein